MQIDDKAMCRHSVRVNTKSRSLDISSVDVAEIRQHFLARSRSSSDDVVQDVEEDVLQIDTKKSIPLFTDVLEPGPKCVELGSPEDRSKCPAS